MNMLDLALLRCMKTQQLLACDEFKDGRNTVVYTIDEDGKRQRDRVIPLFESSNMHDVNWHI